MLDESQDQGLDYLPRDKIAGVMWELLSARGERDELKAELNRVNFTIVARVPPRGLLEQNC